MTNEKQGLVIRYYQDLWRDVHNGSNPRENSETENALRYASFSYIGKLVLDFISKNPYHHKSILSLGCGSGDELHTIKDAYPNARIVGIDTSSDALHRAKTISGNRDLVCASAFHLPFQLNTRFDGILAGQFFDFFGEEEFRTLFGELSSYAYRGTRLYVVLHGYPEEEGWMERPSEFGTFLSHSDKWRIINWELYSMVNLSPYSKGIFIVAEQK